MAAVAMSPMRTTLPYDSLPEDLVTMMLAFLDVDSLMRTRKTDRHHRMLLGVAYLQLRLSLVVSSLTLALGHTLDIPLPQLPLPLALSAVSATTMVIRGLARRLWMLEKGGRWARWKAILEMVFFMRGRKVVVLGDESFGVFSRREAFLRAPEAVRQWKMLSRETCVYHATSDSTRPLMSGDGIMRFYTDPYRQPTVRATASPMFPCGFDRTDPTSEIDGRTYVTYSNLIAFNLMLCIMRLRPAVYRHQWTTTATESAAFQRATTMMREGFESTDTLLPGVHQISYNMKRVMLTNGIEDGFMAFVQMMQWTSMIGRSIQVDVLTSEGAPYAVTRGRLDRVMGDVLGDEVWVKGKKYRERRFWEEVG